MFSPRRRLCRRRNSSMARLKSPVEASFIVGKIFQGSSRAALAALYPMTIARPALDGTHDVEASCDSTGQLGQS
jgi:hypothetical protein